MGFSKQMNADFLIKARKIEGKIKDICIFWFFVLPFSRIKGYK
jgi:hypothetical protein